MRLDILVPAFALALAVPGFAQDRAATGVIYASETPLATARVEFLRADQVVASTTTNSTGRYNVSLPQGQYVVRVTPPASTNLPAEIFQNVAMESADPVFDAFLVSTGNEIQGTVRGLNGAPVPNVRVEARSRTERTANQTRTGPDGRYTFIVRGTVSLQFTGVAAPNAPLNWTASHSNVTGPATVDVNLPFITLSGVVRGIDDQPLPASISLQTTGEAQSVQFSSSNSSTAGPDGRYSVTALSGNGVLNVFPTDTAKQTAFTQLVFELGKDTVRDAKAPAPTAIRGVVRGLEGKPVANVNVHAYSKVGEQLLGQTKTDADGRYTLYVNGAVDMRFSGASSPVAPSSWNLRRRDIDPKLSFSVDVDLPVVKMSGSVKTRAGNPIANASINAVTRFADTDKKTESESTLELRSSSDGTYSGLLLKGSLTVVARPAPSSGLVPISRSVDTMTADVAQDFVLGSGNVLTGTVYGLEKMPVSGATVYVLVATTGQVLGQTRTNAAGQYTIAADGTVALRFNAAAQMQSPPPYTPPSWDFFVHGVDASKSATVDAVLPVARISGIVTDYKGAPFRGGSISAIITNANTQAGRPESLSVGSVQPKEDGSFSFLLFRGSGEFSIGPSPDTRVPPLIVPLEFRSDTTRHIRLQNPPDSK